MIKANLITDASGVYSEHVRDVCNANRDSDVRRGQCRVLLAELMFRDHSMYVVLLIGTYFVTACDL